MLDERRKHILEIVVREYIKTAEPVSSMQVAGRVKTMSPATVRNIFSDLTEDEYIEQPHVSGGRVPKSRAYRVFVNEILDKETELSARLSEVSKIRERQKELARRFRVISRFGNLMPIGFDEVFMEPEFTAPSLIQEFGKFLDEFETHKERYRESLEENPFGIWIGEENKIQPTRHLSVIVGRDTDDDLYFVAGPMRMQYEGIIPLIKLWQKM